MRCVVRIGGFVLSLLAARSVVALDPQQPANSYLRAEFNVEDGLPDNRVNAILQTRNGFLWVATAGGLARFDGDRFTPIRFHAGNLREFPANTLVTTPEGELWVGTDAGLVRIPREAVDHFDRSLVQTYHAGVGLSDQVMSLHLSRNGVIWVGTNRGLYRMDRVKMLAVIPGEDISRVEEASDGRLLIITGNGFVEWDGSRIIRHPELPGELGMRPNEIFHVFEDRQGVTWFCTAGGVARRVNGVLQKISPYGVSMRPAYRVYEDPQGNVWTNTEAGFYRVVANRLEPVAPGLKAKYMYADLDGDLWVGTSNDGLLRYKDRAIRMYTTADGLPAGYPMAVLTGHDGTLWVGNNCGGLSRFDGSRFHTYDEKDGLTNSCVWSLAEDTNHDVWVGTWGGGLYRFRDGSFTSYLRAQRLLSNVVFSIAAARDGSLWYATPDGLIHMQNGKFRNYTTADGLSSDRVISVYQDRSGAVWAGTSAGIDRLAGDRFAPIRREAESDAIPYGPLREDTAGNVYALSVVNGISRIENNRIVRVNGALEPSGMVESADHDFWFGGRSGIFRVAASKLKRGESDQDAPLDYTLFGRADGLNSKECSTGQPNIAITPDGKLWVGTVKGLAMLDPKRVPQRNRKPSIFMEEVKVGQEKRAPGRELTLRPGTYHVALRFTAVDLSSPNNIRIQYRLDGADPEWLDADSTRTAIYTNVPVGTHAFHIRATNGDGVWDREGIVYDITQQPYFYETAVFRLGSLVALGVAVLLFFRFRVHQITSRIHLLFEERLAERTRIARDLHDTLLQSFQGVLLQLQAVKYLLPDRPHEVEKTLERVVEQARQAVMEGRDAVQGLRASTVVTNDLAQAVCKVGEELANEAGENGPRFHVQVEGTTHNLVPLVRDEVHRIACEALRNAFRHAHGERIEVEIRYDRREFRLRVADNGKGIDESVLLEGGREGHHGLPGMRERAKLAGGKLAVFSKTDFGTQIELTIPGSLAYSKVRATPRPMYSGHGS